MRAIALALTSGATLLLINVAALAHQHFEGGWSVEFITEAGSCNPTYTFPLTVQAGQVRLGGAEGMVVATVTSQGAVKGGAERGSIKAEVAGRLTGGSGSGTWAFTGSQACTGRWRAAKAG